ncbi:hypothetical protein K8R30_02355 [archaeon]|nr:hypothetical protein [archaeon]
MELIRKTFNGSELQVSHPLDVLYKINPEIASLAYADSSGVMSPGIRPYVALFRKLQSDEKIALIDGMVRKYGFDAQIEINRESENGMTQRGINEGKNLVNLAKLKYEFGRAVVKDHIDGQKYLSDNELAGVRLESEAQVECVRLTETLRSETSRQLSRDKLEGIIRSSELKYAGLIRQAEIARGMGRDNNRKEIAIAYIKGQVSINRAMIEFYIEEVKMKAVVESAYYETMKEVGREGVGFLRESRKGKFRFRGSGTFGDLNVDIEVE